MQVTMYNVGFGESILLEEDPGKGKECLLVDFGSDTPKSCYTVAATGKNATLQDVANHIIKDTRDKTVSVMLSHFHRDHLEGVLCTDLTDHLQLGDTYIPDIRLLQSAAGTLSFLQVQLLQELFEALILYKEQWHSFTLYDLLVKLMRTQTKLHFLKRGCTFHVDKRCYHVLWPDFSRMKVNGKLAKRLTRLLAVLSRSEDVYAAETLETMDRFIGELVEAFVLLTQGERYMQGRLEQLQTLQEQVIAFYSNLLDQGDPEIKTELKNSLQAMKDQGNRSSIVFCDTPENGRAQILMTGDIPASDLKKIPFDHVSFTAIKAPHHGTKTHYSKNLPQCEKILISNGLPSTQHKRWHKIAAEYAAFYHSNRRCKMICTNARCEIFDLLATGARPCCPCSGVAGGVSRDIRL